MNVTSDDPTEIRTVKVSQKGQVSIPKDIRKRIGISGGDEMVMIADDRRIILEKLDSVALSPDGEFRDVKTLTESTLRKIWLNRHDEKWNRQAKKSAK